MSLYDKMWKLTATWGFVDKKTKEINVTGKTATHAAELFRLTASYPIDRETLIIDSVVEYRY